MNTVLIETPNENGVEWGLSFTDHNPKEEDYFKCESKEDAHKLKSLIETKTSSSQKLITEKEVIAKIQVMCEQSLPPEPFEKWEEVKNYLEETRKDFVSKNI